MAVTLTKPVVNSDNGTWGTKINDALDALNNVIIGAFKSADESVVSSTTLQNDDQLFLSPAIGGVYVVDWSFVVDGHLSGDFKYTFSGPAGSTFQWETRSIGTGDTANVAPSSVDNLSYGYEALHGTLGSGANTKANGSGLLIMGATAGTMNLRWAQQTSNATATKVKTNSWLRAIRIA